MMCSHTNTHLSPEAHGVLVYVHIKTPLTTMETQALFVVQPVIRRPIFFFAAGRKNNGTLDGLLFVINSVKLRLTA